MAESPPDEKFEQKVKNICGLYQEAANLRTKQERVVSTDEMTGIQALERKSPDKPMKPGQRNKREFEYLRHGTQTLIASFDVSSGKILQESIGQTRTESDYLAHLQQMMRRLTPSSRRKTTRCADALREPSSSQMASGDGLLKYPCL